MPALGRTHKAAIVLASLTPELASSIVEEIDDVHLQMFARAFSELKSVPMELLDAISIEFVAEVRKASGQLEGGLEEARRVLTQLTDEERVNRILIEFATKEELSVWQRLDALSPEDLGAYLNTKTPAIAAAIISRLGVERTAAVLEHCDPDFSTKVLLALSRKGPPSQEIIDEIAAGIEAELLAPLASKPDKSGAVGVVGDIINFLPRERREAFLDFLNQEDPEISAEVRKSLLIFEALHARLPESAITNLIKDVDRAALMVALKLGQENAADTVNFILANISKRMADQYREELADLQAVSDSEGEAAQRQIVSAVKRMIQEGNLKLRAIEPDPPSDQG